MDIYDTVLSTVGNDIIGAPSTNVAFFVIIALLVLTILLFTLRAGKLAIATFLVVAVYGVVEFGISSGSTWFAMPSFYMILLWLAVGFIFGSIMLSLIRNTGE